MKRFSTFFLQAVIVLVGLVALVMLIWIPQTEGRAANLDLFSIYADPFILYGYAASVLFFLALYNVFKLLGYIRQNNVFTAKAIDVVKNVKRCLMIFGLLILLSALYIRFSHHPDDDPAGFMSMSALIILSCAVGATAAAIFQHLLQKAVNFKSENDLTV